MSNRPNYSRLRRVSRRVHHHRVNRRAVILGAIARARARGCTCDPEPTIEVHDFTTGYPAKGALVRVAHHLEGCPLNTGEADP